MAVSNTFLSIIIPAYNESNNIKNSCLQIVADYFAKQSYGYEVLVVDDGSTDETRELVTAFCAKNPVFRLIENSHRGKAFAVKTGFEQARGQYLLFTDMDQATPPEEIEKLLPFVESRGYDIAIGSREVMGAKREKEPWYRHLMGKGFNMVVQIFAVRNIHDTQCGFKLFKGYIGKALFEQLKVYDEAKIGQVHGPVVSAFDVELLFLAQKRGYKIAEVPVIWHHVKTERINPIKDSYRMFKDVVKIRINDMMGKYAHKTA